MPGHGKYQNGSYPNRDTKLGYWRAIQSKYNIKHNNKVIGTKQTLAFYEGQHPTGRWTEWVMHEYYLHENECKDAPELKVILIYKS